MGFDLMGMATIMTMPEKLMCHVFMHEEILSFDTRWPQPSDFYITDPGGWRIINLFYPHEVLLLIDAFVNGHRTKVGMPRADVNTLTVS